jgi:hypothetical protein
VDWLAFLRSISYHWAGIRIGIIFGVFGGSLERKAGLVVFQTLKSSRFTWLHYARRKLAYGMVRYYGRKDLRGCLPSLGNIISDTVPLSRRPPS